MFLARPAPYYCRVMPVKLCCACEVHVGAPPVGGEMLGENPLHKSINFLRCSKGMPVKCLSKPKAQPSDFKAITVMSMPVRLCCACD